MNSKMKIVFGKDFLHWKIFFIILRVSLKTNQFNLTTKRYQEEEIKEFTKDDKMIVGCAEVEDKFGESGITNIFIIKKNNV